MRRVLVFATALLLVGGCTVYSDYWSRPGATQADFVAAAEGCDSAALAHFPPVTFGMPGYFVNSQTYCTPTSGGPNCEIINPGYLPQARSSDDTNLWPRQNAFRQCMMAGGWRPFGGAMLTPSSAMPDAAVSQALAYCETIFNREPNVRRTAKSNARFNQCVTTRAQELSGPRPPA